MKTRSTNKMASMEELKVLIKNVSKELGEKIDTLTKKLDEKDKIINDLRTQASLLEEKVAYQEKRYQLLERKLDDCEQYGRRTSLRINGIKFDCRRLLGKGEDGDFKAWC